MQFSGEFHNAIDGKGRLSIPKDFRDLLANGGDERLVVTKNLTGGLSAYPVALWEQVMATMQQASPTPEKNAAIRLMVAPAVPCGFDKQGRIMVPQSLRTHAALDKEAVIIGMFDKIEIYSQSRHAEVTRSSEALLQANPQFLAGMGF
ncbi:division/cell wall cluster transcriptional repressor MraZ [Desulfuromonas versatilis]|uniref:Transcriptional regulator MraZ n=1 Tax=Desulfuromonas versatilis TaxID=2802975 RepID=A0ABN6DV05_9BACT|nr:division/cell wall cluster transcriptional repressor MraZ [Desulfuromonas versatilis]BCR03953.1 division/cell wall cluster transcriptional repressor MraZ [Desulfuromonas versatilis]